MPDVAISLVKRCLYMHAIAGIGRAFSFIGITFKVKRGHVAMRLGSAQNKFL
jgi:hypothetical protein